MHVDGRGICNLGIALQQNADLPLIAHRCWAAAIDFGRPSVIGSTRPGNKPYCAPAR